MYLMESTTSYVERPSAFKACSVSSLIHRSNALGSSHGGKSQNVVVLLFAASPPRRIPFSPRHRPTQKERAQSPGPTCRSANVKRGV
ncbi:hypothetical protein GBA52_028757 [Prunus armeniaca]|nr:hypothetical protein GBA52_028757 [Prunus armeniaca]